ncbi:MAG: cell division protein ZipA C-terminal FtsZ-binding domain-containing protein [Burkholderiales bacterium]|nr:cell division protein ZipA C-terminal FtsZ-binding domain-containing protein [Burkholderiales bacterium]
MSELQLGLLAIGIAVVAGVFAYNKWQEARLRRRTEGAFTARRPDVLLGEGGGPQPPADTAADAAPAAGVASREARDIEHTLGAAIDPAAKAGRSPVLTAGVDFVVEVECPEPVAGQAVHAAVLGHFGSTSRPVHWEGLDTATDTWERGADGGRYELLRIGLQLANRSGPASEAEIAAFAASAQAFAASIGGVAAVPDLREGIAQAAALDRFCAEVDVQVGFNVVRQDGGAFPGTKVRALAETAGCVLDADGWFRRRDEGGAEIYALGPLEGPPFRRDAMRELAVPGLTVALDLPRAPDGPATFRRFLEFTRQVAQALSGTIVDDNRRPLTDAALQRVGAQLEAVQAAMAERGIRAGSAVALRVFS